MAIRSRMKYGREEWFAPCPERACSENFTGPSKRDVQNELNAHAKWHRERKKQEVREAERLKAVNQLAEQKAQKEQAKKDRKDREAKAKRMKTEMSKKAQKLNQVASGYCQYCNRNPCKGSKPGCSRLKAHRMESIMDQLDPSDPGRFDEQLRWYNDNMK